MSLRFISYWHRKCRPCHAEFFPVRTQHHKKKRRTAQSPAYTLLNRSLVRQRSNSLRRVVGERNGTGFPGKARRTLDLDGDALSGGLLLGLGVGLDSLQEVLAGSRGLNVLDSDVDALLDVSVPHLFVNDDTNGALGDVVDNAGLSVVDLVGHTVYSFLSIFASLPQSNWDPRSNLPCQIMAKVLTPAGLHH